MNMRDTKTYRILVSALLGMVLFSCSKDENEIVMPVPEPEVQRTDSLIRWAVSAGSVSVGTRAMVGETSYEGGKYFSYDIDAEGNPVLNADRTDYVYVDNNVVDGYPEKTPVSRNPDCVSLEQACDVNGKLKHGVGFWVDYIKRDGTSKEEFRGVFGDNTSLVYTDVDGTNPYSYWNYKGDAQYWALGGRYLFRAYYPNLLQRYVIEESTNGQLMVLDYNTHKFQEDLMVAHNEVFTTDPLQDGKPTIYYKDGKFSDVLAVTDHVNSNNLGEFHFSQTFDLSDPVPLHFEHTLTAVRVRFTFNYDDDDELTRVFFENTVEGKGLKTSGLLLYGAYENFERYNTSGTYYNPNYPDLNVNGTTAMQFQPFIDLNGDKRTFEWRAQPLAAGIPFYDWQVAETLEDGKTVPTAEQLNDPDLDVYRTGVPLRFTTGADNSTTERMAIAYSDSRDYALRVRNSAGTVTKYIEKVHGQQETIVRNGRNVTVPAELVLEENTTIMDDPATQKPPTFASNEGWLLILPQQSDGTVELCYTTAETSAEGIARLKIPEFTGTNAEGVVYDASDAGHDRKDFCHFVAGRRYTYTVVIGKTNAYLNIMIEPWNVRYSNTDVTF